jgi:hypothetical protein
MIEKMADDIPTRVAMETLYPEKICDIPEN